MKKLYVIEEDKGIVTEERETNRQTDIPLHQRHLSLSPSLPLTPYLSIYPLRDSQLKHSQSKGSKKGKKRGSKGKVDNSCREKEIISKNWFDADEEDEDMEGQIGREGKADAELMEVEEEEEEEEEEAAVREREEDYGTAREDFTTAD